MSDTGESFNEVRDDGRKRREDWVRELADGQWNMHALLEAHDALLDRRRSVRAAAFGALLSLAEEEPEPVEVTPLALLWRYIGAFTVASGAAQEFHRFLVDSDTKEADRILREILHDTDPMRNEDFERLVEYLAENQEDEYLQILEACDLSNKKGKIFRRVKREAGEEE